jgi:hypothetical protein
MPSYPFYTKISNVWCRSERMVEEAERKQRWVDTIMAVMDLVIPGMFRHGQCLVHTFQTSSHLIFKF